MNERGTLTPVRRYRDVSFPVFPGTKMWTIRSGNETAYNIRSHELSSPTTVALLGRRPTRYSMHHYELFNYMTIAYV